MYPFREVVHHDTASWFTQVNKGAAGMVLYTEEHDWIFVACEGC